jgi:hypothetical protein
MMTTTAMMVIMITTTTMMLIMITTTTMMLIMITTTTTTMMIKAITMVMNEDDENNKHNDGDNDISITTNP